VDQKRQRADEIARSLCDHSKWLTHGRSIRKDDLMSLRLKVERTFSTITRARARMLSFVQLLILQGGKESPQFEATFLIGAEPAENRIATGHFWIEANMAK
jgi:hypothetical protein